MITVLNNNFVLSKIIGKGFSVWLGPAEGGGLSGIPERDGREDNLSEIDWSKVVFQTHLKEGETEIFGKEKFRRAKAGKNIPLGKKSFCSAWSNYKNSPENKDGSRPDSILEKMHNLNGVDSIYFFGDIIRDPNGRRCVFGLIRGKRIWAWICAWIDDLWDAETPSAELPV